jgi:hypothetical protein
VPGEHDLVGGELGKCVLDRDDRVAVADLRVDLVDRGFVLERAGGLGRKLLGPSARVVLVSHQPLERTNVRGGRQHTQADVVAPLSTLERRPSLLRRERIKRD